MSVKLLTDIIWSFQASKEIAQVRLGLHLSKCYIVGNHISRLNLTVPMRFSFSGRSDVHIPIFSVRVSDCKSWITNRDGMFGSLHRSYL